MGKKGDLIDFERGVVVGARRAGLSISETVDLLRFSHTTISRVYREWSKKEKISSERQLCGRKCLVDVRGQRRMVRDDRKATVTQLNTHYSQDISIQDYLYSAFHNTIVAKQLYRKLSLYNRFIYCRNVIYLTFGKIWLILYTVWELASSEVLRGVGIISSQVFGHLRSFKGWIQTEACVFLSYHGMLI